MADGDVPDEAAQGVLVEHLGDESHLRGKLDAAPVGDGYARALLASMLQREECKERKAGYIFLRTEDTEDTAALVQVAPLLRQLPGAIIGYRRRRGQPEDQDRQSPVLMLQADRAG